MPCSPVCLIDGQCLLMGSGEQRKLIKLIKVQEQFGMLASKRGCVDQLPPSNSCQIASSYICFDVEAIIRDKLANKQQVAIQFEEK